MHLPLLVTLMLLVAAVPSAIVRRVEVGVDTFLIAHESLHERLVAGGEHAFADRFSRSLI